MAPARREVEHAVGGSSDVLAPPPPPILMWCLMYTYVAGSGKLYSPDVPAPAPIEAMCRIVTAVPLRAQGSPNRTLGGCPCQSRANINLFIHTLYIVGLLAYVLRVSLCLSLSLSLAPPQTGQSKTVAQVGSPPA